MADGRRAAVLGSPVAHSLSPALHTAAYSALGLTNWSYERIECREEELAPLVDTLGPEWVGLSLTMPLKRVALEIADEVSPLAAAVGAANTLLLDGPRRAGPRRADNTDVAGILGALRGAGLTSPRSAVVLGAGGTARAALAALRELGVAAPLVLVRDPRRAEDLCAAAERLGVRPVVTGGLLDGPLPPTDVVVSTLPAGAADTVAAHPWRSRPIVLDAVYAGWPTPLARSAAAAGCTVVGGLAMLLHQAVEQVRLMTGLQPPVESMRAALPSESS